MEQSIYTRYSVNRLILIFSMPAILSLIVELMTGVIDTAFAGHLGGVSEAALTAMGLAAPLLGLFVAVQSLFAVSTAITVSSLFGSQDRRSLDSHLQTGIIMTIVLNTLLSLAVWLMLDPLLGALGAAGEALLQARAYMSVLLISNVFSSVGYLLTSVIRAFGHPKTEMVIITASVVLNIAANAVLTFGLQLGMTGIALGTLVSELICAAVAMLWLKKKGFWFVYRHLPLSETMAITRRLIIIGSVQTVLQSLAGLTAFFVNRQLLEYAGAVQVGAWAVANKVYMLLLMPIIGLTQSVQSILAYFSGRGERDKQRAVSVRTILITAAYGIAGAAASFSAGGWIAGLMSGSSEVTDQAAVMLDLLFLTFPLVGITYTVITLLQVTGYEKQSLLIASFRQVLVVIPLILVLPYAVQSLELQLAPALSVLAAIPIADLLTLLLALYLGRKASKPLQETVRIS
ncbi:MATE family efflux transporter [Sporosarcina sp. NCCP-2716]|uniref:MATE family efflux transporter n=1 Tax=Sporosarcina sp. NCCP-2716 TaxID=2943679 RepID=UPI00203A9C06|nr:MATE family efflux transporter [Sporosarcina sp. NCCP-2716]GKV70155.1 MATE family efflux transporter [Sporosarcina sp. NCCP-2716]